MINLDDRLIKETLPEIKPNALAVLLVVSIHLNKESGVCFPSHDRIMKLTGLGSESVYSALKVLKNAGLLVSTQSIDTKSKTFGRRLFKVNTDLIGVFVTAKNANILPEEEPLTAFPYTAQPHTALPHAENHETYLLNEVERLNKLELINKQQQQAKSDAASGSIHSTLYDPSTPGVVLHESFQLEERSSTNDLVPRRAENSATAPRPWASFDIDEQAENLKYDFQCIERFARDLKCTLEVATEKLPPAVDEFVFDQKTNTYNYNNTRDFRKHFFNWLPLRTKSKRAANTTATNANGYNSNNTQSALPKALQNQVGK